MPCSKSPSLLLQRHDVIPGFASNYSREKSSAVAKGLSENLLLLQRGSVESQEVRRYRRRLLTNQFKAFLSPASCPFQGHRPGTPYPSLPAEAKETANGSQEGVAGRLAQNEGRLHNREVDLTCVCVIHLRV